MESKLTPNISVSDMARQCVSTVMSQQTTTPVQSEHQRDSFKAVLVASLKQAGEPGRCQPHTWWSVYQCEL